MRLVPLSEGVGVDVHSPAAGLIAVAARHRVWLLAAMLAVASALVFVLLILPLPAYDEDGLPWLFFVVAYACAAAVTLRVTALGEVAAFTLAEIPLVIGFYYALPSDLILSQLAGVALALLLTRRQTWVDAVISMGVATLATSTAFIVFLTFAPTGLEAVLASWLASFAAAVAMVAVMLAASAAVDQRSPRGLRPVVVVRNLRLGVVGAAAATSVALVAVMFIRDRPEDLWLVLLPVLVAGVGTASFTAQRERQAKIEFLYECSLGLQRSLLDTDALAATLARTRRMFDADLAEIALVSAGSTHPERVAVGRDGELEPADTLDVAVLRERLALVGSDGDGVLVGRPADNVALAARMKTAGLCDAMIVPLRSAGALMGTLMVANRLPRRASYHRQDLQLLEALAAQVSAALQNSNLVDRLAESLANAIQLAAAVESSDDAILALTGSGAISAWNPAAERLLGYSGPELAGLPGMDLVPPEHREVVSRAFAGITVGESQRRVMSEVLRKDGSRVPISVTLSPISGATGELVGLSVIIHDETERTTADAAVRESVERFRSVFRDSPIGMALTDGELRWSAVNDALCRILERSEEALVGRCFLEFVHPDEADEAAQLVDDLLAADTATGYSTERRYITGAGRTVWTRLTVRRLLDDQSGHARLVCMVEDVTDRRLAAERVHDTEARLHRAIAAFTAVREPASVLRAVLTAARDLLDAEFAAIGVLSEDGTTMVDLHYDGVDAATIAAIGLAPTGQGLLGSVDIASGPARIRDARSHPMAIGQPPGHPTITSFLAVPIVFEGRMVARLYAGNKRRAPEFDADDEGVATALAAQAAVVLENARISARTLALVDELDRANEDLRRANDAKSEFLGTVSHELRTPLHSILVAAELVHDPVFGPLTEKRARELGATIQGSARHLMGLIDDLVDVSRIEAGKVEINPVELRLASLLEEVCDEMRPIAATRGVALEQTCGQDLTIHADPLRIRQVLVNLVANSVKFSEEGEITRIEAHRVEDRIEISVHDTGPGIPAGDLARIFEPFERQAGVDVPGAGLGLAIARRLVGLHDGELTVKSQLGSGSTFTVSLPDRPAGPPSTGLTALQHADPTSTATPGDTILVVEDDVIALGLVTDVLARTGYTVWPASNVAEAVGWIERQLPSLVLLDLRLGTEDGLDIVRLLRSDLRTQTLPVLALSANAMRHDVERAIEAGCDGHLAKPVIARDLLRRIAVLLGRSVVAPGSEQATDEAAAPVT